MEFFQLWNRLWGSCIVLGCGARISWKEGRWFYLKKRTPPPIRSQGKWLRDLHVQNEYDVDRKVAYTIAFNCTLSTKLRTFHFKFLHRRIATNDFLKRINLVQSNKCCFCERKTETITHLFLSCSISEGFCVLNNSYSKGPWEWFCSLRSSFDGAVKSPYLCSYWSCSSACKISSLFLQIRCYQPQP